VVLYKEVALAGGPLLFFVYINDLLDIKLTSQYRSNCSDLTKDLNYNDGLGKLQCKKHICTSVISPENMHEIARKMHKYRCWLGGGLPRATAA